MQLHMHDDHCSSYPNWLLSKGLISIYCLQIPGHALLHGDRRCKNPSVPRTSSLKVPSFWLQGAGLNKLLKRWGTRLGRRVIKRKKVLHHILTRKHLELLQLEVALNYLLDPNY